MRLKTLGVRLKTLGVRLKTLGVRLKTLGVHAQIRNNNNDNDNIRLFCLSAKPVTFITIKRFAPPALDPRAEAEVFESFRELIRDQAALLIWHRLSTVKMVDRICVLEKGAIVDIGTHDQLRPTAGARRALRRTLPDPGPVVSLEKKKTLGRRRYPITPDAKFRC